MNVFETVKQSVTTRQAAEHYGIRVGRNGMACCPFHNDKTPSMKLDRRYHCFGCGADGDVIDFTAALYGLGKKEAAVQLARDFGLSYEEGKLPDKMKSPSPGTNPRRYSSGKRRAIASVFLPIIAICWNAGKPSMRRSPRMRNGIPGLWKPYRKSTMWNICWTRCCPAIRRNGRRSLQNTERM